MRTEIRRWTKVVSLILPVLLFLAACGSILEQHNLDYGTLTPMGRAVMETITARALEAGSGSSQATAFAKATAISAESTAQAEQDNLVYQQTAAAMLPVLEELPRYGVNPLDGQVAWLHPPVTIELDGYSQTGYANDYPEVTAADFVLAADFTWNTQAATASCGYVFRSDGDKEKPNQFNITVARYASGTLYFSALVDGNLANTQAFYPKKKDTSFNGLNDATNRLVVVARGTLIDIYTNGVKIGQVDTTKPPPSTVEAPIFPIRPVDPTPEQLAAYQQALAQYEQVMAQNQANLSEAQRNYNSEKIATFRDGFLSFISASEYGHTTCKFSNAWLFIIGRPPTPTPNLTWTATPTITPTRTPNRVRTATSACATYQAGYPGTPCP
ncbi:MAG: hypothetical protein C3F13_02590 [Anaerolineales bacterium]|nr:MAG: hypothetical protein C3F13_02590 [Anaerolineales bacterium]